MVKGIQLSLTKKNLKNQYINKYILNEKKYKYKILQKEYIKFKKIANINNYNPKNYDSSKLINYQQKINKYFLKKNYLYNKRRLKHLKNKSYHWLTPNKLQSSLIHPYFSLKSKDPYRNYSFRKNLYFKRVLKSFYYPLHFNQSNIESRLEILLVRVHWAISIPQAKSFIKNKFIFSELSSSFTHDPAKYGITPTAEAEHELITSSFSLKSGDTIVASSQLLPIIFHNKLIHSKLGSPLPSYLFSSSYKFTLLSNPSLSDSLFPSTLPNTSLN